MPLLAFATAHTIPDLTADDQLAVQALAQHDIQVLPAVWNDPAVDWHAFDAVVVRSCWDYHLQHRAFATWIDTVEQAGVPCWNLPATLRWNMEKTYLQQLSEHGIVVPFTIWAARGDSIDLPTVLAQHELSRAVVKPTISATAFQTFTTTPASAATDNAAAAAILQQSGLMVQRFVSHVTSAGEWSLMFFNKQYSHAVIKRPKAGDFRVQSDFGGTSEAAQPPAALITQAQHVVDTVAAPLLYARVDGVDVDGTFVLMELELIEPFLFLSKAPHAAARFAAAVATLL